MIRSLMVVLLAIVCGASAVIGVNRMRAKPATIAAQTQAVYVAVKAIRRGAVIREEDLKSTEWPAALVPASVARERNEIIGHTAIAGITADEPFFTAKLANSRSGGFASNVIKKGMRACSILTKGPSASVAGFVRPGDRVDVLANLKGSANDETGGSTAITLLHGVEILAIDDVMESASSSIMKDWLKEGVSSVTLLVTPDQALQLSLGQTNGATLSLALRNGDDTEIKDAPPVTMKMIRDLRSPPAPQLELANAAPSPPADLDATEPPLQMSPRQAPSPRAVAYIRTLRGTLSGQIQVVGVAGASR